MLRLPVLIWRLGLVVTVAGCGGAVSLEDGSGGRGGGEPAASSAMETFALEVTRAACERDVRCGTYLDVENCEAEGSPTGVSILPLLDPAQAHHLRYTLGLDLYSDLEHEYALADLATLEACLKEMRDGSCNLAAFRPESCQRALVPEAPRAAGESCEPPSQALPPRPCQAGLFCDCGLCRPRAPGEEGEPCGSTGFCLPGLECDFDDDTCRALPGLGEACQGRCAEGSCREGTCERRGGLGEPCQVYFECALDAACVDGLCTMLDEGGPGSACAWDSETACSSGYCVFDQPESTRGTCGTPSLELAGPCNGMGPTPSCPAGSYTLGRDPDSGRCECRPELKPGEACDDSGSSAPCGASTCFGGICTELPGPGQPCSTELGCEYGLFCSGDEGACVALCVK